MKITVRQKNHFKSLITLTHTHVQFKRIGVRGRKKKSYSNIKLTHHEEAIQIILVQVSSTRKSHF